MKHIQLQANHLLTFSPASLELLIRQGFVVDVMKNDLPMESYFQPLQETSNRSFYNLKADISSVIESIVQVGGICLENQFYNMESFVPIRGVRIRLGVNRVNPNETYPVLAPVLEIVDCL